MGKPSVTGPLFKWFGSKWMAARYYPAPEHDVVMEPFGGCAGYSLRHHEKQVHIAEANMQVFSLWKWLIRDATQQDILDIPVDLPEGLDIRTLWMSSGQELLLKMWQRTNNVGDCWTISPWGNKPGQWTRNTRSRVAEQFEAVRHWGLAPCGLQMLREQGAQPIERTWFVDPPYMYNYQYRLPLQVDYVELGNMVRQLNGQVIVCEAMCSKTQRVPDWLPFEFFREQITSRRKAHQSHHSKELMYLRNQ